MIMDKGLGLRHAEDMTAACADLIDYVKLGYGTSQVVRGLEDKIRIYKEGGLTVYLGGTLFEAFVIRKMFDDYRRYIDKLGLDTVEVSDGSMSMDHDLKCEYIHHLAKNYTVLSEVGSKESRVHIQPHEWISMMENELQAGAFKVIGESTESGSVGIYRPSGKAQVGLIQKILAHINREKIIWEAPLKSQQVWFIRHFGPNVNLGNISPAEIAPLETLRLGLRGETFFQYLPEEYKIYEP
jgi:phosphosulfolactate synthase